MNRIIRTVTAILLCGMLCCPVVEAQGRRPGRTEHNTVNNNHGGRPGGSSRPNRPGNGGSHNPGNNNPGRPNRPGNGGSHNPGNNNPGRPNRPGNGGSHNPGNNNPGRPNRPGNGGSHNPGNNNPGRPNRPGNGGSHNPGRPERPQPNHRPNHPNRPNRPNRPGHGHIGHRPPHAGLPSRPHLPPMRPFRRPVPPPAWRPVGHYPVLTTVLGISFGTALNLSINALVNSGYDVVGYGDNMVFLTNVPQLNVYWPDATLYYGPGGGLVSSQFVYSTPYNDMARYNTVYSRLVNLYGLPVSYNNAGTTLSASWFGQNGQFVSLNFSPQYTSGGQMHYFTTLSFGN